MDVLLFSAHPDDVDFGMGGTFLKLSKKHKVVHVILTRGEAGTYGTPQEREDEARAAAAFAGAEVEFLDFKDNHVEDNVENAKLLAAIIRKYKPKVVFAPYHSIPGGHNDGRSHPDHIALGKLTLKACRFAKFKNALVQGEPHLVSRLIYFMVPGYQKPDFIVDISDVVEDLEKLWQCYASQLNIRNGNIVDILKTDRHRLGMNNGFKFAEGFLVDTPLVANEELILKF